MRDRPVQTLPHPRQERTAEQTGSPTKLPEHHVVDRAATVTVVTINEIHDGLFHGGHVTGGDPPRPGGVEFGDEAGKTGREQGGAGGSPSQPDHLAAAGAAWPDHAAGGCAGLTLGGSFVVALIKLP